jgi:hypothetical protein
MLMLRLREGSLRVSACCEHFAACSGRVSLSAVVKACARRQLLGCFASRARSRAACPSARASSPVRPAHDPAQVAPLLHHDQPLDLDCSTGVSEIFRAAPFMLMLVLS